MTVPPPVIHRTSIFPLSRLASGESLLWEGRPSLVVHLVRPIALLALTGVFGLALSLNHHEISSLDADIMTWALLVALLLLMPVSMLRMGAGAMAIGLMAILVAIMVASLGPAVSFAPMLLGVLALPYHLIIWKHTAFAISDRRIMTQYGVFNIRFGDTRHERISNVTVHQTLLERLLGFGDITFSTSGETGGIASDHPAARSDHKGAVRWEDVPRPFHVRREAEEAILAPPFRGAGPSVLISRAPSAIHPPLDAEERLVKLGELLDKGLISQEEHDAKRQEILSRL